MDQAKIVLVARSGPPMVVSTDEFSFLDDAPKELRKNGSVKGLYIEWGAKVDTEYLWGEIYFLDRDGWHPFPTPVHDGGTLYVNFPAQMSATSLTKVIRAFGVNGDDVIGVDIRIPFGQARPQVLDQMAEVRAKEPGPLPKG